MKIRLANKSDLNTLEIMFNNIVNEMHKNEIFIWNEYYPFEEFESDINKKRLYVLTENNDIISAFALLDTIQGRDCFSWQDNSSKSMYIARLGVNTKFLHKGVGSKTLQETIQICKQNNVKFLRLTVAEENFPAINLYLKNKFIKVAGQYKEYSESLSKTISEIGFELKI